MAMESEEGRSVEGDARWCCGRVGSMGWLSWGQEARHALCTVGTQQQQQKLEDKFVRSIRPAWETCPGVKQPLRCLI